MADGGRRKFRREGEVQRQGDLIAAALDLIAEGGPQAATVRAIAARAGVTPGLIRHYFHTKEDLLCAAYASFMQRMTDDHRATVAEGVADPVARLARFVVASLTPPMVDTRAVGLWAGFIHLVQHDPVMRAVHHKTYHAFRFELDVLIAEALASVGRSDSSEELRRHAISCNALIDGLWMEGSSLPDAFSDGELPRLGLANIGLLLGLDLAGALED